MANEIKYSGLGDLRLAEVLSKEVLLLLADRNALPNHPALVYAGEANEQGSAVIKVSQIGFNGYDQLASVAEAASVGNTALTDGSATVTVGRYAKAYEATDLARLTDSMGMLSNPAFWAADAVTSGAMTLTNLIAALMGGFSSTVGTTTVNLSVAQWFEASAILDIANVQGPYMAVLHPQQWADLQAGLRAETGAIAYNPATPEQISFRGGNFKGNLYGVDLFTSSQIATANAGADRAGGMFGKGAVLWADATPPADVSGTSLVAGKLKVSFETNAAAALSKIVTTGFLGTAEGIDAAGVSIITDA